MKKWWPVGDLVARFLSEVVPWGKHGWLEFSHFQVCRCIKKTYTTYSDSLTYMIRYLQYVWIYISMLVYTSVVCMLYVLSMFVYVVYKHISIYTAFSSKKPPIRKKTAKFHLLTARLQSKPFKMWALPEWYVFQATYMTFFSWRGGNAVLVWGGVVFGSWLWIFGKTCWFITHFQRFRQGPALALLLSLCGLCPAQWRRHMSGSMMLNV